MTFLEAVKELSEGRCTKIKRSIYNGYVYLDEDELKHDFDSAVLTCIEDIIADDWQLVDPTPQTEEVEVVRWLAYDPSITRDEQVTSVATEEAVDIYCAANVNRIKVKLTGTYTRPIKPKVRKREQVMLYQDGICFKKMVGKPPEEALLYAEWEAEV